MTNKTFSISLDALRAHCAAMSTGTMTISIESLNAIQQELEEWWDKVRKGRKEDL